jgi:hypothetical protein
MKKSLILVALLIGSISVMAKSNKNSTKSTKSYKKSTKSNKKSNSSKSYVGIGMASGSGKYTLGESKTSYNSSSISVKFGMILQNDNRFELSYETEKHKFENQDDKVSGFNFDWNFAYPKDKIADVITPYWTLGLGYYTYEDTANKFEGNKDLTGAAFNYGIGGLYDINKNIELEASYKFKGIVWQDYTTKGTDITTKSNSAGSLFYLGLNYKL